MTGTLLDRQAVVMPEPGIRRRAEQVARRLSWVAEGLMVVAAIAGLAMDDLYRDPDGLRHMLRGHDLVVLVAVAPTLAGSLVMARRGARRGRLVWLGTLAFATYNYAIYVFGTRFNDLFLVHVAIFEVAVVALILGLTSTRARSTTLGQRPSRAAAGLLGFLAVGLGGMWVFYALRFAINGDTPAESELVLPLASTHLGYALDLTLIVPAYAAAAVLLWRRAPWGEVVAPMLLVGGLLQQLTYLSALIFQTRADVPGATAFDPGEPIVIAAYVAALSLVLRRTPERRNGQVTHRPLGPWR